MVGWVRGLVSSIGILAGFDGVFFWFFSFFVCFSFGGWMAVGTDGFGQCLDCDGL